MSSSSLHTYRMTVSENTNVPRNIPRVACTIRLRRKPLSMRGLNWLLTSCRTTSVMEKMRPVTEIVEDEMVPSTSRAASGPPSNTNSRAGSDSPRSQVGMRKPRMRAAATLTAGIAQKGRQSWSHLVSRGMSGTEPRIRKLWEVPSLPSS